MTIPVQVNSLAPCAERSSVTHLPSADIECRLTSRATLAPSATLTYPVSDLISYPPHHWRKHCQNKEVHNRKVGLPYSEQV